MTGDVRVLLLEDSVTDAELIERELRRAAIAFTAKRVDSKVAFLAALGEFSPDLILADHTLRSFDALSALSLANEATPDAAFIIVSGTMGEELAIESLKRGVSDYVLKTRLARLGPVVRRALRDKEDRTRLREAEWALRLSEERFRSAFENAPIGMAIVELNGRAVQVNRSLSELLGRSDEELLTATMAELAHPDDAEGVEMTLERMLAGEIETHRGERRYRHANGRVVWTLEGLSLIRDDDGRPLHFIAQIQDTTAAKEAEQKLAYQAVHDPLTGLPNRTLMMDRLAHALARSDRHSTSVAVMFMDLDEFKVINDSLGHEAGDRVLAAVAERIRSVLRRGDTAARFGGDEFVLIWEDLTGVDEAESIAGRIQEALGPPFLVEGREVRLTASVGIALAAGLEASPESLIRDADAAMYRAKEWGRAHHALFDEGMRLRVVGRLETESELGRAIDRGEFRVFYQPQVELDTGRIVGFEALVRWDHPDRGLVAPSEFISVAEDTGLIVPLGRWVLQEACRQAAEWKAEHVGDGLTLAVNLSPRQLAHPNLVHVVTDELSESGVDPQALCLEFTESALMVASESTLGSLGGLRRLGVRFAIDDFGTGYSSLSYITQFHPDVIKVDKLFIDRLEADPEGSAIVTAVVGLAHTLGLVAIAEGVETGEQLSRLRSMGCDCAQGYLFARPEPAQRALEILQHAPSW